MNLIVFDIDGTLVKDNKISNITFRKTIMQMYGISNFDTNWDNYKHMTDIGILRDICWIHRGITLQWKDVLEFENNYLNNYIEYKMSNQNEISPFRGILQVFSLLNENASWKYAIYTGGLKRIAQIKISSFGIDFRAIPVGYAQDGVDRINIFRAAIEKAKVVYNQDAFRKIVLVGDSNSDFKVAKHYSIPMIGILGTLTKKQFEEKGITSVLTDYSDVNGFLQMINAV